MTDAPASRKASVLATCRFTTAIISAAFTTCADSNIATSARANPDSPEPIGGDSYWFGSLEYSIPILEKETASQPALRVVHDAGAVGARPYSFSGNFDDDWGLGFRLNIPHLGPLRLDYGIPITHDSNNGSSGQFQFTVGYTRQF